MTTSNEHNNAPAVPQGEPVAWLDLSKLSASAMVYATGWKSNDKQSPLYTTPAPSPAQEVGLTDELEQLGHIANGIRICGVHDKRFVAQRIDDIIAALRAKGGK